MKRKTMKATAKDVMYTEFNTLRPDISISDAVHMMKPVKKSIKKFSG